ncbi:MAG: type II toxin-antitoxin system Phd/YefM family antitoxin [Deltaproteobacteria bacterium]|nr:type II toxin-antitoxin system Phd/YefM family antitoxin [Deltaproteobacteria bacterium]
MKEQVIGAAVFKAKCLAILDEVARTGRTVVVTKRGKPIARLAPVESSQKRPLADGILFLADDLVSPTGDVWSTDP